VSCEVSKESASQRVRQVAETIYLYHLKYEKDHDARAVFAYIYFNITLDLAQKLEDSQFEFEDPEWVADLAQAFAKRYCSAMNAIDTWLEKKHHLHDSASIKTIYNTVPKPWADVYLAICGKQSYVIEDLVFAMCAHISYDLPNALLAVDPKLDSLAARTEFIQEAVGERYQHFLIWLDWLVGSFDEFFTNYGIRVARSVAWYNAMRLLAPSSKEQALASIERSTFQFINSVRNPKEWWMCLAVRFFRLVIPRRRKWPTPTLQKPIITREFDTEQIATKSSRW
jgi:hypothetical protein